MIEAERTPGFLHLLQMTGGASWLHMCIHNRETESFLSSATGLDKLIAAAMVSEDTRSRLRVHVLIHFQSWAISGRVHVEI